MCGMEKPSIGKGRTLRLETSNTLETPSFEAEGCARHAIKWASYPII